MGGKEWGLISQDVPQEIFSCTTQPDALLALLPRVVPFSVTTMSYSCSIFFMWHTGYSN